MLISFVVPMFNEANGVQQFHAQLKAAITGCWQHKFEIIYINDGSTDTTGEEVRALAANDGCIKLIQLSRNFGKENALTAGIAAAKGDAIITLDGDGQHPVDEIGTFIKAWQDGAQVVVGVRSTAVTKFGKELGSKSFYSLINFFNDQAVQQGTTDFRLIDRQVQQAFLQLTETSRMTRSLIDWLGFKRTYVPITLLARSTGVPGYSYKKLFKLATDSIVSQTVKPMYVFAYVGIAISALSLLTGISIIIEQLILEDPLHWNFTGTAMLSILLLFLVGVVLMSQGIISLYVANIHNQSKNRPLYVTDYDNSIGIKG